MSLFAISAENVFATSTRLRRRMKIRTKIQYRIDDVVEIDLGNGDLYAIVRKIVEMQPDELRRIISPRDASELAAAALRCVEQSIDDAPMFHERDVADFKETVVRIAEKMESKAQRFGVIERKKKA